MPELLLRMYSYDDATSYRPLGFNRNCRQGGAEWSALEGQLATTHEKMELAYNEARLNEVAFREGAQPSLDSDYYDGDMTSRAFGIDGAANARRRKKLNEEATSWDLAVTLWLYPYLTFGGTRRASGSTQSWQDRRIAYQVCNTRNDAIVSLFLPTCAYCRCIVWMPDGRPSSPFLPQSILLLHNITHCSPAMKF